jgi:putative transposase
MLSEGEFDVWAARVGLAGRADALVRAVRSGDPARRPHSGRRNVAGRYPSRKMGVTIAYESRTVELRAIYQYEHDAAVVEFWDQPWSFRLRYKAPERGFVGPLHTPDFLVLYEDGPVFEEWKTDDGLRHQAAKNRHRYQQDEDGEWVSPPAQEAARELGLGYRVRASSELSVTLSTNLEFLADLFDEEHVDPELRRRIRAAVMARPGITVDELVSEVE